MLRNKFNNFVLEVPEHVQVASESRLNECRVERKSEVLLEPATVGAPIELRTEGCVTKNADGSMKITAGGRCGNIAGIEGPPMQP